MINVKDGNITLNDIVISPDLTKCQLLNSHFYTLHVKSENDMGNSYIWYYFKPLKILNLNLCIAICFYRDDLFFIEMSAAGDEFPISWDNGSEEGELKRKKVHDKFLKQIFTREADEDNLSPYPISRYKCNWGEVYSVFDPKSGSSKIGVSYKRLKISK